jgi:hypothetical protein
LVLGIKPLNGFPEIGWGSPDRKPLKDDPFLSLTFDQKELESHKPILFGVVERHVQNA